MGLMELLILLVIAGVCGWIAEALVGFSPGGFLISVVVGLIGALLGSWLAPRLGLPPVLSLRQLLPEAGGIFPFDLIWSILGAVVLLLAISLIRSAGRRPVVVRR